jgi:hypothetical protein
VLSLFGEQRNQSQATLAEALERADRHQLSIKSGPKLPETTLSGVSGVSALSTVGVAASLAPPKPSSADIDAAFAGRDGRRFVKVAVIGGLCAAVGLAAVLFLSNSAKQVEPAVGAKTAGSGPVAAHADAPPPSVDLNALPVEPEAAASAPSPSADASASEAPTRKAAGAPRLPAPAAAPPAPAPAPAKAASAAPPAKPSWKHDPGF